MLRRLCRAWLALCLLLAGGSACAQAGAAEGGDGAARGPQISLITFGPGSLYWERFGHNAILVETRFGARLYNYGFFDFQQENFFLNFARGRMLYQLGVQAWPDALAIYQADGRWAYQQKLDLDPGQRRRLAYLLAHNAQPENAEYRYDYFNANCSTRVRDALDEASGGALRRASAGRSSGRSYRFEATRLIAPDLALALGMDLGMGPAADAPLDLWQQSFVPMVLMDVARQARVRLADGSERPLVAEAGWLLESSLHAEPATPPRWLVQALLLGLGSAAALILLQRARRHRGARRAFATLAVLLTLLSALGGLILLAGWLATEHWVMAANRNLLLLNPLGLLLLPTLFASRRADWQPRLRHWLLAGLIAFGACMTPLLLLLPGAQQNLPWIALWLPVHAALAFALIPSPSSASRRGE